MNKDNLVSKCYIRVQLTVFVFSVLNHAVQNTQCLHLKNACLN